MDANLARRIEVLEFEVHRWKVLTVVVLIAMTVLVVAAAAPPQFQVNPEDRFVQQVPAGKLAAHDFTLVGEDGRPYARLGTRQLGVGSSKLSAGDNLPFLEFYDSKGEVIWSAPPNRGGFTPVEVNDLQQPRLKIWVPAICGIASSYSRTESSMKSLCTQIVICV
jgi:hypothetical protein